MSSYEYSEETKELLNEVHTEVREHGRDGNAIRITSSKPYSVIYWDEETEQYLYTCHVEGRWRYLPDENFPKGMEILYSWDDYEVAPVEETKLYHAEYGLDRAREG